MLFRCAIVDKLHNARASFLYAEAASPRKITLLPLSFLRRLHERAQTGIALTCCSFWTVNHLLSRFLRGAKRLPCAVTMDGMDYDPMVMDGEPEQPQVKISAVCDVFPYAPVLISCLRLFI